jgi:hypothetical protein
VCLGTVVPVNSVVLGTTWPALLVFKISHRERLPFIFIHKEALKSILCVSNISSAVAIDCVIWTGWMIIQDNRKVKLTDKLTLGLDIV